MYRYSSEIASVSHYQAYCLSWRQLYHFGALLDCKILPKCKKAHMLVAQPLLTPDLNAFPNALRVFARHIQLVKDIFENVARNDQRLLTPQMLYLICTRAQIQVQYLVSSLTLQVFLLSQEHLSLSA